MKYHPKSDCQNYCSGCPRVYRMNLTVALMDIEHEQQIVDLAQ